MAAVAAHFGRDLGASLARIEAVLADAVERGCHLVVFPNAALGGYLASFDEAVDDTGPQDRPPALDPDGPEVRRLIALAGAVVLCIGYCEVDGDRRFNAAVCLPATASSAATARSTSRPPRSPPTRPATASAPSTRLWGGSGC